jgi:hypothetical protein
MNDSSQVWISLISTGPVTLAQILPSLNEARLPDSACELEMMFALSRLWERAAHRRPVLITESYNQTRTERCTRKAKENQEGGSLVNIL